MSRSRRTAAAATIEKIDRMGTPESRQAGGVDVAALLDDSDDSGVRLSPAKDDGAMHGDHEVPSNDVRRDVAVDPVLERSRPTTLSERLARMPAPRGADLAPKSIEQKIADWKARIERAIKDPRWSSGLVPYTIRVMYLAILGFCRATLEGRQYGGPNDGASFDLRSLVGKHVAPFGKTIEERLRSMFAAIREFRAQEDGRAFEASLKPEQRYAYAGIEKLCEDALGEADRRSGRRIPLVKSIGLDLETFSTPAA